MSDEERPVANRYVVVDVETNGLDYDLHEPVEVAWWDLATGERGQFIPRHDVSGVLSRASTEALRVNRYLDRIADAEQDPGRQEQHRLRRRLEGAVLVGSNPRFDAAMLRKLYDGPEEPWHYRLLDVGAYGAGVLGLDPANGVPGLWTLCELLNVSLPPEIAHTAWGDVSATGEVLQRLWALAAIPGSRTTMRAES